MRSDHKGGFFSFKKMIAVPFVMGLYFIVFMGINLCTFVLLLNQFYLQIKEIPKIEILEKHPYLWLIFFLAIHLFWRLFCEGVVIVFRIYETLISIESVMKEEGEIKDKLTEAIKIKMPSQKIRSREDFKKWKERRFKLSSHRKEEP